MKKIALVLILLTLPLHVYGADLFIIPKNVVAMYVFIQKAGGLERGSSEEVGSALSKDEFLSNFSRYASIAKQRNARLIITAQTDDSHWVHNSITYKGKNLKPTRYRNEGIDKICPGAEVPLD